MSIAQKHTHKCKHAQYNVVAIIFKKDKIISIGVNSPKTHPIITSPKTLHAELNAVIKAKKQNIRGASIFTIRTTHSGKLGMAKPCPTCESILRDRGINHVLFTNSKLAVQELYY